MSEAAASAGTTPAKAVTMVAARTATELRIRDETVLAQPDKDTYPQSITKMRFPTDEKLSHDKSNGNDCRSRSASYAGTRNVPLGETGQVGIIARVPLASGLLPGKYTRDTEFPEDDHRNCNRDGAAFDVGEALSGASSMW